MEDDTDKARGINIDFKTEDPRTLSGLVWEDNNEKITESSGYKHGSGDSKDKIADVNDVIVQLIEVIEIKGKRYEYIWQETTTGPNGKVKTLVNNGGSITTYNKTVTANGEYKFTKFIPGDYIIRFVYGDGTYSDYYGNNDGNIPGTVKTYNGQDYKSAITDKLNLYNPNEYLTYVGDNSTKSDAIDNEARRLEVMAITALVDKTLGETLKNNPHLANTWMCAESPRLDVKLEEDKTDISGMLNKSDYKTNIEKINFGLEKRPESRLELEKHLTDLKISTSAGPILDTANNQKDNFKQFDGDRDNRGKWYFETDIDELIKGSNLEAKYTYTIRNVGDIDYLSNTLVNKYKTVNIGDYKADLLTKFNEVKTNIKGKTHSNGKYLGQAYYIGTPVATDAKVTTRAEELQEAINNKLTFNVDIQDNSGIDFEKANSAAEERKILNTDGMTTRNELINTIVKTKTLEGTKLSEKSLIPETQEQRQILLTRAISGSSDELSYDSYIAEIWEYSNAAGRKNVVATGAKTNLSAGEDVVPGNLDSRYVHSDDEGKTMTNSNEPDESWAETITISKPTGGVEEESNNIMIVIIATSAIAVIGAGIVLIKKFVLKK